MKNYIKKKQKQGYNIRKYKEIRRVLKKEWKEENREVLVH